MLCQLPPGASAGEAWSPDGNFIVFSRGNRPRLYQVSARGGTPSLLIKPNESEENLAFVRPHFLPLNGGRRVLLFAIGGWAKSRIVLRDLETGAQEILANGNLPVYSPSGHILYQESEVVEGLWALPYSIETLKPTGEAFPVARQGTGPSVSANGTLVYRQSDAGGLKQLGWRDRRGEKLGLVGQPQESIGYPALSPDGQQVAVRSTESGNYDIWIHDVARPVKTRLTIDPGLDSFPTWSSAGDHIAFASTRLSNGGYDVFLIPVDGSTEAKSLVATSSEFEWVTDWSKNREFLLYERRVPKTLSDLWYSRGKDGSGAYEAVPFLQTPFRERGAKFSPDGLFVAYYSDESGRFEIYARPFLEDGKRVQVSTSGGVLPRWSRNGKEIYYIEGDTLVSVGVTRTPSLTVNSQNKLFRHAGLRGAWVSPYDVSADGQKFVVVETLEEESPPTIRVVQNWYEEFLSVSANSATPPRVAPGGVVHSASFVVDPLAPGTIVSIFGSNLSSEPASGGGRSAATVPLPTELAGTQVILGGLPLPILFSREDQVNAVLPFELADRLNESLPLLARRTDAATLAVPEPVLVNVARPGVFTQNASGGGPGSIQNVNFQIVTPARPAKAGDAIIIYGTGLGGVSPGVASGDPAPASPLARTSEDVTVTIGGRPANVLPGFTSLYQVNAVVPAGVPAGEAEVVISIAGQASPVVTLAVE